MSVVQLGAFNPATNTGVIALNGCSPNGSSVGPDSKILLGCTPQNNPSDVIQLVINAVSKKQTAIADITGSDEVWFNWGDDRYYTGSSRNCKVFPPPGGNCAAASQQAAVLGVIDAKSNQLIETIPQSSNSHSVAADLKRQPDLRSAGCTGFGRHRRRHDHRWTRPLRPGHQRMRRGLPA